jgi:lipopolysaccharide export system permease protein
VAYAGSVLVLLSVLLGEVLAPPMQQLAREHKAFSKFANVSFAGRGGAWIRDGELILNVEQQIGDRQFGGLYLYRLDDTHRLRTMGRASAARTEDATGENAAGWSLEQYVESSFKGDNVEVRREERRVLESNLTAEFVGVAAASPAKLPSSALWRMIAHLEANNLDTREPTFAFWSRIARTLAVMAAVLLALPFVFGTLRSAGAGARVAVGFILGIGFFMLQKVLESGTVVFAGNPVIMAWVPTLLMALTALTLLARTR